jgi:tetratricopeptide (TPR) repeat protein
VDFYQAQRLNPSQLGLISKMQNATDAATIQKLSGMLVQAKAPVAPAITEASVSGPANAPAVAEVKRGLLQLGRKGQQASPKSSPPTESAELIAMKAAKAVEQPRAVEQLAAASAEPTKPLVKQANDKPANAKPDGVTKGEPVLTARTLPSVEERTPQPPIDDSDAKLRSKLSEASAFARAGKVKEALAAYSVAIEMRSDFASVYLDRGTLYLKAGSPREAAADFTQAVKLDSRNVKAWMGKCVASVELNLGRDAVLDCNEVLKAEPRNADAVYQRGRAHAQAKNYPEAIRDLRSATELRYDFPEAHLTLGRVYVTINELILGLREFTLAVQKRPGFKDAYRERAEIRRLLGDLLGQQEDLARAGDQRAIPNGSAGLD